MGTLHQVRDNKNTEQFVAIASAVSFHFPELDVRFTRRDGSAVVRYQASGTSPETFELRLGAKPTRQLINEAILNLKAVARMFDA